MTSLHLQTRFQNRHFHILPMPGKTSVLNAAMVISGRGAGAGCIHAAAGVGVHPCYSGGGGGGCIQGGWIWWGCIREEGWWIWWGSSGGGGEYAGGGASRGLIWWGCIQRDASGVGSMLQQEGCILDAPSPPCEQNDTYMWKHYLCCFATQCIR